MYSIVHMYSIAHVSVRLPEHMNTCDKKQVTY